MRHVVLVVAGVVLLSAAAISAQDPKQVEAGKQLFSSKQCVKCHQVEGRGTRPTNSTASRQRSAPTI